jgi:hypothetical protein
MKGCTVYFRDEAIYVLCQSETVFGIWISCEPMFKLSKNEASNTLGETVLKTLQFSQSKIPQPDNLETVTKVFLKFTGFKNWRAFSKRASTVFVKYDGAQVEVTPYIADGRGNFEPLLEKVVKCPPNPEAVEELLYSKFQDTLKNHYRENKIDSYQFTMKLHFIFDR